MQFKKSAVFVVSCLVHFNSLLQNATDITKWDSYFITKCDKSLLQNALVFLLQNTTVLLQNATIFKPNSKNKESSTI